MKLILAGFFRRWWLRYLVACLFATLFDLLPGFVPLPWVPYLFAPWLAGLLVMLDLISGAAQCSVALPVSTRQVGRAYWLAAVCVPPIALVGTQCLAGLLAGLFGNPTASPGSLPWERGGDAADIPFNLPEFLSWQSIALNFVVSLVLSGFSFFGATLLPMNSLKQFENDLSTKIWNALTALGITVLFNAGIMSSLGMPSILDTAQGNDAALLSLLALGLVFLVLGYVRAESMILRWARLRPQQGAAVRARAQFKPGAAFASAGLPSLFLDTSWMTLMMVCSVLLGGFIFKTLRGNWVFIHYTLFFCSIMAALRFTQSLRPLRTLPISTNKLALTFFFLPVANAAFYLATIGLAWSFGWNAGVSTGPWAAVVLNMGLACLSGALCLRFGIKALVIMAFLSIWIVMVFVLVSERLHYPPSFFWATGLVLMISSLALVRRWLTSSQSYRFRGDPSAAISTA